MPCYSKQLWIRGGGKSGIHLAEVSDFAGMTGKNRHFRDLSHDQQVLSGVPSYDDNNDNYNNNNNNTIRNTVSWTEHS